MQDEIENIEKEYQRIEDYYKIENMLGLYSYHLAASLWGEIIDMFALSQADVRAEMLWGVYDGAESVKNCFSFKNPLIAQKANLKGEMSLRPVYSPVIVVADDGKTARAVWMGPGLDSGKSRSGEYEANWTWVKYAADLIREVNGWKFWHFHVYDIFSSPFEKCWTDVPPHDPFCGLDEKEYLAMKMPGVPDRGPTTRFKFNALAAPVADQPLVPVPYSSFDEVAHPY